jgi:hypothetical protein
VKASVRQVPTEIIASDNKRKEETKARTEIVMW